MALALRTFVYLVNLQQIWKIIKSILNTSVEFLLHLHIYNHNTVKVCPDFFIKSASYNNKK